MGLGRASRAVLSVAGLLLLCLVGLVVFSVLDEAALRWAGARRESVAVDVVASGARLAERSSWLQHGGRVTSIVGGLLAPQPEARAGDGDGEGRGPPRSTITFYVQNPRTGSLFLSGRLARHGSARYTYRALHLKTMEPRPTASEEAFVHAMAQDPGLKVIVWDSGGTPNFFLKHWPARTVLVMTGDESGRWGLFHSERYWGPFGSNADALFKANESAEHRPILLPLSVRPWFRQYYDFKQTEAFGRDVIYMPLGSRSEFPDVDPASLLPASKRSYVYSLMASATDSSRRLLMSVLHNETRIPKAKRFLHMAARWHPELTNEEYVQPEEYQKILLNSVFAPCPKGHSIETFRLYEAIESGAIPVIDLAKGYTLKHLPAEYFSSPMVFVDDWTDAPDAMLSLLADRPALDRRQAELAAWYARMMRNVTLSLEALLERR